jgi:hypothetical protein
VSLERAPGGYAHWLAELKSAIATSRQRAVVAANTELVGLYWRIGRDILDRQAKYGWCAKIIERLAHDLWTAFPEMRGFSRANLMYMRAFAEAWPDREIVQQLVGQLSWSAKPRAPHPAQDRPVAPVLRRARHRARLVTPPDLNFVRVDQKVEGFSQVGCDSSAVEAAVR